jgi:hypothetical protein
VIWLTSVILLISLNIIARDGLISNDDVFNHAFLLCLSLTTLTGLYQQHPLITQSWFRSADTPSFKELVKDCYSMDMQFANKKWTKYGKDFLQLDISFKLGAFPQLSMQVIHLAIWNVILTFCLMYFSSKGNKYIF